MSSRLHVLSVGIGLLLILAPAASRAGATGFPSTCVIGSVLDGDTFVCTDSNVVSLLAVNAPELSECGGGWARAALEHIFLRPGTKVRLEYDAFRGDRLGVTLAAPIVTARDGAEYNISIVMAYVGLARASTATGQKVRLQDWALAAETWARTAGWNMWAPGGPFSGGGRCG